MKKILFCLLIGTSFISQSCINDNEDPVLVTKSDGARVDPDVGGPTQPNQVWFDLGTETEILTKRSNWDLGFYSGNEFKVILNSSIMMAAGKIEGATNIDLVTEASVATLKTQVQVANFNPSNVNYIDDVKGNIPVGYTAIEDIKANDSDNAVYLVNMGKEVYNGSVPVGSVVTGGDDRGWMKVQVVRSGTGYKVKYAALNSTSHKELSINKNATYNYNFVSLKNNSEVSIQPEKKRWDICFTVFTNTITGAGSYIYADFVTLNNVGGAAAYEVVVPSTSSGVEAYTNFKTSDIDQSKFISNDQRVIGSNWRNPVGANGLEVYGDRFYVVRDAEGFFFKLRFTRITKATTDSQGQAGERGFPTFEYKPL
ncbi:HmuY family protein [Chryseobacterium sp. YIM B08800]|uniref:HmuY family protein n=1 Tax=Chryseobacterium sp. YIM B08800 TaxID=2984136 RepID=UPI00223EC966|nr:HmuY family protein [Chryseobacterium sp. YIM B08800]